MEAKSKGMAWLGEIYQKFEAMCMEVDDIVCQETLRYVESQLQTVGSNVQQFCTELIEELLPTSPTDPVEDLNSNQVQNIVVAAYEDLNVSVDEYHSRTEPIDSSSVISVEGVDSGLSSKQSTEDMHPLVQIFINDLEDNDSTADDTSLMSMGEYSIMFYLKCYFVLFYQNYMFLVTEVTPLFEKIKVEESYFIVDSSEVHSLYNEVGERRSYKKTLREALFSKLRLAKRDDVTSALSRYTDEHESQDEEFSESNWEIVETSSS
ncbi:hypothetical protein HRI_003017300 [Hibiscus trionum]|uniref:Uncharacterized protein n=1 Tax=Hibiscus trionum TaxID=183268 RepID=A0A9W7IBS8_HIBTR|nr:hypothetical protein HRI_003017300 [Hibiscus trionum]